MRDLSPRTQPAANKLRKQLEIRPADFHASQLIAELADGWLGYINRVQIADNTVYLYLVALRNLGKFLTDPGDSKLTLTDHKSGVLERMSDWGIQLAQDYPYPNATPQSHLTRIRVLSKAFVADSQECDSIVSKWAESKVRNYVGASHRKTLDEFSHNELKEITRAARDVVRTFETLLNAGSELLTEPSPGSGSTASLIQQLSEKPFDSQGRRNGREARNVWKELAKRGYDTKSLKQFVPGPPYYSLLLPHALYCTAIRTLIHSKLDWPPETTNYLQRRDVIFEGNRVIIRWKKKRAHKHQDIALPILREGKGWSPGDLFLRAHRALSFGHQFGSEDDSFWTSSVGFSNYRDANFPNWIKAHSNFIESARLSTIIKLAQIQISEPHNIIRLRKTSKSIRAIKMGDINDAAGSDHRPSTFSNSYLNTTTVNVLAAKTIESTQNFVLEKIAPTIVPFSSDEITRMDVPAALNDIATNVSAESATDRKLSISACQDPHHSPFQALNTICTMPAEYCLQCPNAVFLKDHGSRLLLLKKILKAKKLELSPPQFQDRFGVAWTNLLTAIEALEINESDSQSSDEDLYQPITRF